MSAKARASAARVLERVIDGGQLLDEALRVALRADGGPAPVHAALVQELSFGTLRWLQQLEALATRALAKPMRDRDLRALLLVGLYQLLHMRIPAHAAVANTVEAAGVLGHPQGKGLLNACLRRFLREREHWLRDLRADPVATYSHPPWLLAEIQSTWPQHWRDIVEANNARPPLVLRVNLRRTTRADYLARLRAAGMAGAAIEHTDCAVALERAVPVAELPGFAEGCASVQDAAAQLAAPALDLHAGQRVLDACAAPGGKLCHILERCPGLARVTALEKERLRLGLIEQNLVRLGLHAELTLGDAMEPTAWWDGTPFDRILLDAPCSATGVIRRHPDIKVHRDPAEVAKLAQMQGVLLERLWGLLAPGGRLLYVTCSILPIENEERLRAFLADHAEARPLALALPFAIAREPGAQILPGHGGMDGFFYGCLQKD